MSDAVRDIHHGTVDEFIRAVVHGRRRGAIYRGVADAEYGLVPSIARPKILERLKKKAGSPPRYSDSIDPEFDAIRAYEGFLLSKFYQQATRAGMAVPDVAEWVHQSLSEVADTAFAQPRSDWGNATPYRDFWPLLAWMQHLGIETRLLDWTIDPAAAAFFAAYGSHHGDAIAVWELDTRTLRYTAHRSSSLPRPGLSTESNQYFSDCLVVLNPAVPVSKNKTRQSGCFTLALADPQAHNGSVVVHKRHVASGAEYLDHRKVFEYLFNGWQELSRDVTNAPKLEPLRRHLLLRENVEELRSVIEAFGYNGLSMLSEGFSVEMLFSSEVDKWIRSGNWTEA